MSERSFVERVRDRIESPERRSDLTVTYAVRGGAPGEAFEERIELSGTGEVSVRVSDDLEQKPVGEASGSVDEEELEGLLRTIGASLDDLVTRSEASFPPDTTVGSITVEIDGEEETYYFDADDAYERVSDERERSAAAKEPTRELREAPFDHTVYRIDRLERRLLEGER